MSSTRLGCRIRVHERVEAGARDFQPHNAHLQLKRYWNLLHHMDWHDHRDSLPCVTVLDGYVHIVVGRADANCRHCQQVAPAAQVLPHRNRVRVRTWPRAEHFNTATCGTTWTAGIASTESNDSFHERLQLALTPLRLSGYLRRPLSRPLRCYPPIHHEMLVRLFLETTFAPIRQPESPQLSLP